MCVCVCVGGGGGGGEDFPRQTIIIFVCVIVCENNFFPLASSCR